MEGVAATRCLDACAVMAYVRQEPGAEVLKALIERPTTVLAMDVCHLGEVYDDFFREDGLTAAQTAWHTPSPCRSNSGERPMMRSSRGLAS